MGLIFKLHKKELKHLFSIVLLDDCFRITRKSRFNLIYFLYRLTVDIKQFSNLCYLWKIRRLKVTKKSLGDEIFNRLNKWPTNVFGR